MTITTASLPLLALAALSSPDGAGRSLSTPEPADPYVWETLGTEQGLPAERVLSVALGEDCVWAGTEAGLARVADDGVSVLGTEDGLPFPVVTALAVDPRSGELWVGTLGGLAHVSAGRVEAFTQLDSGLVNDVIYGVAVDGTDVWVATAAGLNRFDQLGRSWEIYDVSNTLMHEPWCYAVTTANHDVYVAIWGGGVVVRDGATGVFREHRDPDGEMELDLYRDDGLLHDVTSSICVMDGVLWAGTYFGLSRFDGKNWRSFNQEDSGLVNDFINQLGTDGRYLWVATDGGVSRLSARGDEWLSWGRAEGEETWTLRAVHADGTDAQRLLEAGPASELVFGVAAGDDDVWLATARGLSHGRVRRPDTEGGI